MDKADVFKTNHLVLCLLKVCLIRSGQLIESLFYGTHSSLQNLSGPDQRGSKKPTARRGLRGTCIVQE